MPSIRVKRGSRAQIISAAAVSGLKAGEVYLITDEDRIAVGTGVNTFETFAKESESGGAPPTTNIDGGSATSSGSALTAINGGSA